MKKVIKIQNIEVEANSCTVGFRVSSRFGDQELGVSAKEITHGALYKMLDQADEVIDSVKELAASGRIAVIQVGKYIEIDVWQIVR